MEEEKRMESFVNKESKQVKTIIETKDEEDRRVKLMNKNFNDDQKR